MKKLHAFQLAYNEPELCREAIALFERYGGYPPSSKTIIDQHWPLSSAATRAERLMAIAQEFGWDYADPGKNLGVAGGYNWLIDHKKPDDGDIIFSIDPDERPQTVGYADAMMRVFEADHSAVTVQVNHGIPEYTALPHQVLEIGGVKVNHYDRVTAWSMGAFSVGWLKRLGGMSQPHKVYGHVETQMYNKFYPLGGRAFILPDYKSVHLEGNAIYRQWKDAAARFQTQLDFAGWLMYYCERQ